METLQSASRKITLLKKRAPTKTVGLIFGGFDLLYYDHIALFLFAKKHVDVLVVAVESDNSVHALKGENRPTETQHKRVIVLEQLKPLDMVVALTHTFDPQKDATKTYQKIAQDLKIDAIITNPLADRFYKQKMQIATSLGIKYLPLVDPKNQSFTSITKELAL